MIGAVREKLQNVQLDFSQGLQRLKQTTASSIRQHSEYFASSSGDLGSSTNVQAVLEPEAGAHLLHHWQCAWHQLERGHEQNVSSADECSAELVRAQRKARAAANNLLLMHNHIAHTPSVSDALAQLMADCDDLQSSCSDVESALDHLEVICETQHYQERKLDSKFELALYTEHKMAEMSERKEKLVADYEQKRQLRKTMQETQLKEKQAVCHQQFEQDLKLYLDRDQDLVDHSHEHVQNHQPIDSPEQVPDQSAFSSSSTNNEEPIVDNQALEQFLADVKLDDSGIAGSEGQDEEEGQSTL